MSPGGVFEGGDPQLGRLASLARMLTRWYSIAALLFGVVGGSAGAVFFMRKGVLPPSAWLGVWLLLVASTAANLFLSPRLALMEGCGLVGQVARLRLKQSIAGYVLLWTLLASGAGLWAAASIPLAGAAGTSLWLRSNGRALRWLERRAPDPLHRLQWRLDVLPFQWRIAVSWISGYFIFNLFTPLIFSRHGAIEAGKLGLALTIFGAASTIGMSWVNAKTPLLTAMISRQERVPLNALFRNVALRSILVTGAICICVVLGDAALTLLGVPLTRRVASLSVLCVLAAVTTTNVIVFCMATYMRAHREEPMLAQSVTTAVLIGIAALWGSRVSVLAMMSLYLAIVMLISLPWTAWLFTRYYRRS